MPGIASTIRPNCLGDQVTWNNGMHGESNSEEHSQGLQILLTSKVAFQKKLSFLSAPAEVLPAATYYARTLPTATSSEIICASSNEAARPMKECI